MIPSVTVTNLSKSYGECSALRDLNLSVPSGNIYGLIGPNGAGKTTSLAILAGLVRPTSGTVRILGQDVEPNRSALAAKIGFASPQYSFFDYLTGTEILLACGLMHGLDAREARSRLKDLLILLDLDRAAGHYIYQYSHGMRQKLSLGCAMIHSPRVLLLDEPFLGLDPTSVYRISQALKQMSAGGRTIVLTSHDLPLVARLCHRIGILHEGVLKRELVLPPEPADDGAAGGGNPGLESVLWEVIGAPGYQHLSWI